MLTFVKTGIITIILSFISGVLLDQYKNRTPRVVCNISGGQAVENDEKKIKLYTVTVKNISKTTINNLNLNLHAACDCLKIDNAKITKGLKFDISSEDNIYDVSIPFLSKNDEFSVKVILEDSKEVNCIPSAVLRSPESFKIINSRKNMAKNTTARTSIKRGGRQERKLDKVNFFMSKKVAITAVAIAALLCIGVFAVKSIGKIDNKLGTSYESTNNDSLGSSSNDKSKSLGSGGSTKSESSNGTSSNSSDKSTSSSASDNKGASKEESSSYVSKSKDKSKEESKKNTSSSEKSEGSNKEPASENNEGNSGEKTEVQRTK